jgi:hypothetical protein
MLNTLSLMKKQIFALTALLIMSMFSFRAVSQPKADSIPVDVPIGVPPQEQDAVMQFTADSAAVNTQAEKSLQRLHANVQLTPEQVEKLKRLFIKKEQVRGQIYETLPQSENFKQLRSEFRNLNTQVKAILTSEQLLKLEKKKKEKKKVTAR